MSQLISSHIFTHMPTLQTVRSIYSSRDHYYFTEGIIHINDKRYVYTHADTDIINWCFENFGGKHRKRWGFSNVSNTVYIADKELAMAFKLMWE